VNSRVLFARAPVVGLYLFVSVNRLATQVIGFVTTIGVIRLATRLVGSTRGGVGEG